MKSFLKITLKIFLSIPVGLLALLGSILLLPLVAVGLIVKLPLVAIEDLWGID